MGLWGDVARLRAGRAEAQDRKKACLTLTDSIEETKMNSGSPGDVKMPSLAGRG